MRFCTSFLQLFEQGPRKIDNWGRIFIYSCFTLLISFEIYCFYALYRSFAVRVMSCCSAAALLRQDTKVAEEFQIVTDIKSFETKIMLIVIIPALEANGLVFSRFSVFRSGRSRIF